MIKTRTRTPNKGMMGPRMHCFCLHFTNVRQHGTIKRQIQLSISHPCIFFQYSLSRIPLCLTSSPSTALPRFSQQSSCFSPYTHSPASDSNNLLPYPSFGARTRTRFRRRRLIPPQAYTATSVTDQLTSRRVPGRWLMKRRW